MLGTFELTDAADRVLKGYSGGMRLRFDLAASLMIRPPVLFLDEPTTGLDPNEPLPGLRHSRSPNRRMSRRFHAAMVG